MTDDQELEASIIAFLVAVNERLNADQRIRARTAEIRPAQKHDPDDAHRYVAEFRAVYTDEDLDSLFREIDALGRAVLVATDEDEITGPVSVMTVLTGEERVDVRKLLNQLGQLPDATPGKKFGLLLVALGFGLKAAVRVAQLQQQATELAAYCLVRFPPGDD